MFASGGCPRPITRRFSAAVSRASMPCRWPSWCASTAVRGTPGPSRRPAESISVSPHTAASGSLWSTTNHCLGWGSRIIVLACSASIDVRYALCSRTDGPLPWPRPAVVQDPVEAARQLIQDRFRPTHVLDAQLHLYRHAVAFGVAQTLGATPACAFLLFRFRQELALGQPFRPRLLRLDVN